MEELYKRQLHLQSKIANAYEKYRKLNSNDKNRGRVSAYLEHINVNYESFKKNHEAILALDSLDLKHQYFLLNLFDSVEDSYFNQKGDFNEVLYQFDKAEALESGASEQCLQVSNHNQILVHSQMSVDALLSSLTDAKLPKFSGKFDDWENFRDLFRSLIHRRDDLANVLKMNILKSTLEGEAASHLTGLEVTDDNYTRAWEILINYYDNKRRLVNAHLSSLFSAKSMASEETAKDLSRLARETFTPLNLLKSMGRPVDTWDDIVIFMTVSRFHNDTRLDWHKELGDSSVPPTLDQLRTFIQTRILTLEANESNSRNVCL